MKKSFSRGTALVAGTAMLLINGVVYAWSIYSSPFVEGFGWSSAKLGDVYKRQGVQSVGTEFRQAAHGVVPILRETQHQREQPFCF